MEKNATNTRPVARPHISWKGGPEVAPAGSAGCLSVCPPAGFIALAVSTGCKREFLSSIKVLLSLRHKKLVQITATQVNGRTSPLALDVPAPP